MVRDLVWSHADTLIWLDYPFLLVLWRLFRPTLTRGLRREELWNGNRERLRDQFLSRDSIFLWLFKSYWRRRRQVPELLARPEYAHLDVFRFRSPGETQRWLDGVSRLPRHAT